MEISPDTSVRVRKWEVFPGKNKFCCNGRLVTGTQLGIFYFTCVLIIGTSGLFFGVEYAACFVVDTIDHVVCLIAK